MTTDETLESFDAVGKFLFENGIYVTLAAYPLVPRDEVGAFIERHDVVAEKRELLRVLDDDDALVHVDLRRGEADAFGGVHRLEHVVDETTDAIVDCLDCVADFDARTVDLRR